MLYCVDVWTCLDALQGAAGVLQLAWGKDQVLAVLLPQCVAAAAYRAQAVKVLYDYFIHSLLQLLLHHYVSILAATAHLETDSEIIA